MSVEAFTVLHVVISLIGIATGLVALVGLIGGKRLEGWTAVFLATTVLTSLTGFAFPIEKLTPALIFGVISMIVLAVALAARYKYDMQGRWRLTYIVSSTFALYLNAFVAIVQSFLKIPALHELAPTQAEPPFAIAQLALLAAFIWLGLRASTRFRSSPAAA